MSVSPCARESLSGSDAISSVWTSLKRQYIGCPGQEIALRQRAPARHSSDDRYYEQEARRRRHRWAQSASMPNAPDAGVLHTANCIRVPNESSITDANDSVLISPRARRITGRSGRARGIHCADEQRRMRPCRALTGVSFSSRWPRPEAPAFAGIAHAPGRRRPRRGQSVAAGTRDRLPPLRSFHRASRRRDLRRHLGRPRFEDPQRRRHPQTVRGRHEAYRRAEPSLARRLLRRRLPLARRHRAAAKRPRTYNFWENRMPPGLHAVEPNEFGFHEFMRLCRLVGAEPVRRGERGLRDAAGVSRLGVVQQRAGRDDFTRRRARRQRRAGALQRQVLGRGQRILGLRRQHDRRRIRHAPTAGSSRSARRTSQPFFVAAGPRGHSADGDVGWTEGFFAGIRTRAGLGVRVDGFALHYYTDFRQTAEDGARFDAKGWYAVLHKGAHIENVIDQHWADHGQVRPRAPHEARHRRVGQLVPRRHRSWARDYILSQTITLRDALHAAMTFDIFNRHADKIEMANVAQTINCLHSLFAAVGRQVHTDARLLDVRDVPSAHGRPARARRRSTSPTSRFRCSTATRRCRPLRLGVGSRATSSP